MSVPTRANGEVQSSLFLQACSLWRWHSLAAKVGDLKSGRLTTQATSKLSDTLFNAVLRDEEIAIHDAIFKNRHQLTVFISEVAKHLERQDATHVSDIEKFSPLWTNVFRTLFFFSRSWMR